MTPMLQQAIQLLPLTRLELINKIKQEVRENPMLEETPLQDTEQIEIEGDTKENDDSGVDDDLDNYLKMSMRDISPQQYIGREKPSLENTLSKEVSLSEYLESQLSLSVENDDDRYLGSVIIGNINEDGFLSSGLKEISRFTMATMEDTERLLRIIQGFDPPGIGARDVKECLMIQSAYLPEHADIAKILVGGYLDNLNKINSKKLGKELSLSPSDIESAIEAIKGLNLKPGNAYISSARTQFVTPDVIVHKFEGEYQVALNEDDIPRLKVDPYYSKIIEGCDGETKEYLKERFKSAIWLIKCIEQRRQTLLKVSRSIVKFQTEFLDNGVPSLKPLVLKDVADDIGMHKSTVSRVTRGKYIYTPQGFLELKFFFHKSVSAVSGKDDISSYRVKQMIREAVEMEEKKKPLTDMELISMLRSKDVSIARRTVTKYRKELNIPSGSKRRVE